MSVRARIGSAMTAALLASIAAPSAAERVEKVVLTAPDAVLVRAGRFTMGSDDADIAFAVALCRAHVAEPEICQAGAFADEQPRHDVVLRAYRIDRAEVSRGSYLACVAAGACAPPRTSDLDPRVARPELPVTSVLASEAEVYCARLGGRLPTEAEWERAARGSSQRRFPWGMHWNSRLASHAPDARGADAVALRQASPVDAFPDGASAYGLLNMAGNVWELTADRHASDAYARSARTDPRGPAEGTARVIRGGSYQSPPHDLRVTARAALPEQEARADVGFRCAYDVRPTEPSSPPPEAARGGP